MATTQVPTTDFPSIAPAAVALASFASPSREGELSDDDLEHVVGGLARSWIVPDDAASAFEPSAPR